MTLTIDSANVQNVFDTLAGLQPGAVVQFRYPSLTGPEELRRLKVETITRHEIAGYDLDRHIDQAFRNDMIAQLELPTADESHCVVWEEAGAIVGTYAAGLSQLVAEIIADSGNKFLKSSGEKTRFLKVVASVDEAPADLLTQAGEC